MSEFEAEEIITFIYCYFENRTGTHYRLLDRGGHFTLMTENNKLSGTIVRVFFDTCDIESSFKNRLMYTSWSSSISDIVLSND